MRSLTALLLSASCVVARAEVPARRTFEFHNPDELRAIMRHAGLVELEKATLRDMAPIWLVPVGEGSK